MWQILRNQKCAVTRGKEKKVGVNLMNIHGIETDSMTNGDGLRVILWASGCNHHCKGCHNSQTWNPESGREMNAGDIMEIFAELTKDHISGLTFSGGDPLHPDNREMVTWLAQQFKSQFPNKTIWLYTGYLYEEIADLEVMQYIDVLVDGEFKEELADVNYPWAGSRNQRVINVNKTKEKGEAVLHESK